MSEKDPVHIDEFLDQTLQPSAGTPPANYSVLMEVVAGWTLPQALADDCKVSSMIRGGPKDPIVVGATVTKRFFELIEQDPMGILSVEGSRPCAVR